MLRSHGNEVNFVPRAYATGEDIAKAYNDVFIFSKISAMTSKIYSRMVWDEALRCRAVFSDRRLKSFLLDGLLPEGQAEIRNFLSHSLGADNHNVLSKVQALGDSV